MNFFLVVGYVLGFPFFAEAQTQVSPLTWEQVVRIASEDNPAVRSARENLSAVETQALSARSGYFPALSAGFNYAYSNSATTIGNSGIVGQVSSSSNNFVVSTSLSQNLFNGLSDLGKVAQAQANVGIARATLKTVLAQVSYNLKQSFQALSYAKKMILVTHSIALRREQNLRLVELRFSDGRENQGSVLLYRAYLKDAKYSELQSRDALGTAQAQLAQALGMDAFSHLDIEGSVPVQEPSAGPDLKLLATQTPSYLQASSQVDYNEASIRVSRAGFFPTLDLTGTFQKSGAWFPSNDLWAVQTSLRIPLFNGGRDYFATRAASQNFMAVQKTLNDTAHVSLVSLQQSRMSYIEAFEKYQVDRSYLEAAQVRADIARANYNNGLTSFQDWDLVETDLIAREKAVLQSEQNRVITQAAWEQVQGKGVIDGA